jgi:hypothetical protein
MRILISSTLAAIETLPIFYYNRSTGTRFLTLAQFAALENKPDALFDSNSRRSSVCRTAESLRYPEIDISRRLRVHPPGPRSPERRTPAHPSAARRLPQVARHLPRHCRRLRDESDANIEWRNGWFGVDSAA